MVAKVRVVEEQNVISNYCLYSGISSDTIVPLIEVLKGLNYGTTLNLYINSRGGVVPVAIGIFNFIKTIKGLKVHTYNVGHCDSAATLLFMAGERRHVLKNASFYMHSLQVRLQQPQTIKSLETELFNLKEDTKNFLGLLAQNSNISMQGWKSFMSDKGTLIRAKKALSLGIANVIIDNTAKER